MDCLIFVVYVLACGAIIGLCVRWLKRNPGPIWFALLLALCCGCIGSESLMTSQACIGEHASRQAANLDEIARLTADLPISPRMAELLRDNAESAVRIKAWTDLTQAHVGRAEAPPHIMTSAETGAQAVYRNEIALRQQLREALPFDVPGVGDRDEGLFGALLGGGPMAILSTVFGIFLKKKHKKEKATRDRLQVAHAAGLEAIALIRDSPDPELKKRAAECPNLVEIYADQKLGEYETRAMQLRQSGRV